MTKKKPPAPLKQTSEDELDEMFPDEVLSIIPAHRYLFKALEELSPGFEKEVEEKQARKGIDKKKH